MKLHFRVFLALLAVASKSVTKAITSLDFNSAYGYLTNVGIPLANAIREAEANCAKANNTQTREEPCARIIDGFSARLGEFPYQVGLLGRLNSGESVCGGSLLSAKRVVTAAHCWFDGKSQVRSFTVVLGSITLYSGGTRLQTSRVVMHNRWNPRMLSDDIAMVYLPNDVAFSSTISPIALPSGGDINNNFAGDIATTSGFGLTRDGGKITGSSYLSYIKLQVITNSQCSAFYAIVRPTNICTKGANRRNTCNGDSGGPLVVTKNNKRILVGVTSFGALRCEGGSPAAFTRVTSYISWIQQHM